MERLKKRTWQVFIRASWSKSGRGKWVLMASLANPMLAGDVAKMLKTDGYKVRMRDSFGQIIKDYKPYYSKWRR